MSTTKHICSVNVAHATATVDIDYGNCDFILRSAAEVERLWSVADHYLDGARNNATPVLFESLIFSRVNGEYWDEKLIADSYREALKESALPIRVDNRMNDDDLHVQMNELNICD